MAELRFGGRCSRHPLNILPCTACGTVAAHKELATRLRALATGRVEWRVADPKTGGIAIWFDSTDGHDPERLAREWLADIRARFPGSQHARKEVVRAVVFSQLERAALDAAAVLDPHGVDLPDAPVHIDRERMERALAGERFPLPQDATTPEQICDAIDTLASRVREGTRGGGNG